MNNKRNRISGYYSSIDRSAMSEAATSRIQFIRNKSTINRRNIMSSSRQINDSTMNETNNNYASYVVSDIPRQKRVSSVLKYHPGKLKV